MTITRDVDINETIYTLEVELTEVTPYRPKTFDRPAEGPEYNVLSVRCVSIRLACFDSPLPPQYIDESNQLPYGQAVWDAMDYDEQRKFFDSAAESRFAA